jgi:hypothetical protein
LCPFSGRFLSQGLFCVDLSGYAKGLTLANKPHSKVVHRKKLNQYGELVLEVEESIKDLLSPRYDPTEGLKKFSNE